ncbi:MAG: DUF222 domain-containing protein [Mycobacteriales bacterium]
MDISGMVVALRGDTDAPPDPAARIIELSELIAVAEASRAAAIAAFDAGGAAGAEGSTTASWLRQHLRLDRTTASAMVHTARALRELPATTDALTTGRISYQHAVAMGAIVRDAPIDVVRATEIDMVVVAERTTPGQLRGYLARIRHAYAPDAVVRDEQDRYARRSLDLTTSFERLDAVSGWLDPEVGTALRIALEAHTGPPSADDHRTHAQRRHDALGDLVQDWLARAGLPDVGGERPQLVLTAGVTTLRGDKGSPAAELERHGPVSGEMARRIACDATVLRAILDGPSQVLDIGRASRIVPSGMRRALVLRDGGCVACGAPAGWCDAHHVVHWIDGGKTKLDNLVLLCRRHHRQLHEGRFTLHPASGGGWETRPPPTRTRHPDDYRLTA